jgi:hypothetical protein
MTRLLRAAQFAHSICFILLYLFYYTSTSLLIHPFHFLAVDPTELASHTRGLCISLACGYADSCDV